MPWDPDAATTLPRAATATTLPGRVVVVNDASVVRGGATSLALLSVRRLASRGIPVTLFTGDAGAPPGSLPPQVEVAGAGSAHILQGGRAAAALRGLLNLPAEAALRRWIAARDRPDTVYHLHGWSKILSPAVFRALRPVAGRLVISAHDFFMACPNGGYFDFRRHRPCDLAPMSAACVATDCDRRHYGHKLWRVARHGIRDALCGLGRDDVPVLAVHEAMLPLLARGGMPPARLGALRNPVLPWCADRIPAERNRGLLFVGRLEEDKGVLLAAAAARQAGVALRVVGAGPLAGRLAAEYPAVEQCGWQDRDSIAALAAGARALVMPSGYREAFGLVAVEALASGLPVIVPDYAMLAEEVVQGGFGLACDPYDTAALAAAMRRLDDDDALVAGMSRRARAGGQRLAPTPEAWTDALLATYRGLLQRAGAGVGR